MQVEPCSLSPTFALSAGVVLSAESNLVTSKLVCQVPAGMVSGAAALWLLASSPPEQAATARQSGTIVRMRIRIPLFVMIRS